MRYIELQELVEINNNTIEMLMATIESIKNNEHNPITYMSIKNGYGYPNIEGIQSLIADCRRENVEYEALMQAEYDDMVNY